jgi:hypothetical protein
MPRPFPPAEGELDYQYIVLPGGFSEDKWVEAAEMRPGNRSVVHHAVVYIREPGSTWLRDAKPGVPYVPPGQTPRERLVAGITTSEILLVYSPGNVPEQWPPGLAKLIKAGSDLVLETHYTPNGHAASDRSKLGWFCAERAPADDDARWQRPFPHPARASALRPGARNAAQRRHLAWLLPAYASARAQLRIQPGGTRRRQAYAAREPVQFLLAAFLSAGHPAALKAGTELEFVGYFDNSRRNPNNPDPKKPCASVRRAGKR